MVYETAHEQWVRLGMQDKARKEAERKAILATPLWPPPEVVPVIDTPPPDPDARAPTSMPIEDWMAHENKRLAKREKARLEADVPKDGNIGVGGLMRGTRGAYRY